MEIRPWADEDTDWWVALRLAWSDAFGEAQLRRIAAGQIAALHHRAVAWEGNRRVGYAQIVYPPGHDEANVLVLVEPDRRGAGIGSTLFSDLLEHAPDGVLAGGMPDDDSRSRAIADHWGFTVVSRAIRSRLDLADLAELPEPAPGRTIRVVEPGGPATDRVGLGELLAASDTSPEAVDLGWQSSVEAFERMFPGIIWVVVEDHGAPVAVASALPQDDGHWVVIYTGVLPDRRRQGLARQAKSALHALAAERGARTLTTDNEARNTEVLALNTSLGYRRIGGEVRLRR